jgi:hypothetical protein
LLSNSGKIECLERGEIEKELRSMGIVTNEKNMKHVKLHSFSTVSVEFYEIVIITLIHNVTIVLN